MAIVMSPCLRRGYFSTLTINGAMWNKEQIEQIELNASGIYDIRSIEDLVDTTFETKEIEAYYSHPEFKDFEIRVFLNGGRCQKTINIRMNLSANYLSLWVMFLIPLSFMTS